MHHWEFPIQEQIISMLTCPIADSRTGWYATAVVELITVTNYIFGMQLPAFNFKVGGVSERPESSMTE